MASMLAPKIGKMVFIALSTIVLYLIIKEILNNILFQKAKEEANKKAQTIILVITNIIKYFLIVIAVLMILDVSGIDTKGLMASLGILSIIIGLSLQDLLKDIIAGVAILTENQFSVGDNIKIGDFRGEVTYLGLKTTRIKSYTGETKIISNRNITEVINYSLKPSKSLIDLNIAYEEDYGKVKQIIDDVANKLEFDYVIKKAEIQGIDSFKDNYYVIRVVAVTQPLQDNKFKKAFLEEILKEFKKNKIKKPYQKMEVQHEK
ncbi:MAG: mechanosensitive ion channel family protein [Bacilli bacterium]|nr:mechanosensitive ion channel family protein [Bacilli bacterium]